MEDKLSKQDGSGTGGLDSDMDDVQRIGCDDAEGTHVIQRGVSVVME
jgi:hypothetical protein